MELLVQPNSKIIIIYLNIFRMLALAAGLLVVGLVHGQDPTHKPPQPVPSPCPTDINPYWEVGVKL